MSNARELLQKAIVSGDLATATALAGMDPSWLDIVLSGGATPILLALYVGKRPCAEALARLKPRLTIAEAAALGRGNALLAMLAADPVQANARSPDGFPALGLAVFFGQLRCAALLLGAGADPDAAADNPMKVTPIHSACAQADEAVACALARLLLAFGANPNVHQQAGWTPLHAAAHRDQARLVGVLLAAGADPTLRNDEGVDALALATAEGRAQALQALS